MLLFISKKILPVLAFAAAVFLGVKYLLPVVFPFLVGAGVALLAEPLVRPVGQKAGRPLGAALGVSLTLAVLSGVVVLVGAVAVQQVGRLAGAMPQMADTAMKSMDTLKLWLSDLSAKAPEPIGPALQNTVTEFFADGTGVFKQMTGQLPGALTSVIGSVSSGALSVGTGIISAFLISCRLPKIREYLSKQPWFSSFSEACSRVFTALGGWLKAQLKLCAVTWGIVSAGFLFLQIPNAIWWALLVAIVDAVPILGTGTVLVPWAVVCLLQEESLRAIGLLCIYGTAALTRTVLEPRLVGSQLGLDPLVTLGALYVGFRFWGFPGLLFTPILASAAKSLLTSQKSQ